MLSLYSSLMIFLFFNMYWELRDFWQYRWAQSDLLDLRVENLWIPVKWENNGVKSKQLHAEILHGAGDAENGGLSPVVIFVHGFSDNKVYARYLTVPIALAGFDVVAVDCRGAGKSRKAGNKNQFPETIMDLGDVITHIRSLPGWEKRPITLVGFSLGAMAAVNQGLKHPAVDKIIAIASMGNYRENMPFSPIPFKKNWWIWFRYQLFGVITNPHDAMNLELSPALQLQAARVNFNSDEEWAEYISRTLYLVHARNDHIIPLSNFDLIRSSGSVPESNCVLTKRGGHMFRRYETVVIAAILRVLHQ